MKKADIEYLAYLIKNSKEKPIVFLGAGASITGNIPVANKIVDYILEKYKDNPNVKKDSEKTYKSLMNCLLPNERNILLKEYIDNAKINVTHIYLAQFIKNELIDYVLTVNFDNLMLRALALYNIYPPTYDMAILKDITTSTFPTKSIVYLHGQHHGLWLLNTEEELKKVKEVIPPILNSIKDRPWIFIGYSANDPIFDHIAELGRFDKGLYWVARKETSISDKVRKNLLDKENTNSFLIEGFDSDSFMLELNSKLQLEQPEILEKPFSYLQNSLDNIVDIQDEEHFKGIKERLEIIKTQVNESIEIYEKSDNEDNLIKEIIDLRLKENFDERKINKLYEKAKKLNKQKINNSLSDLFNDWGNFFSDLVKEKNDISLYKQAFRKYEIASKLNLKNENIFYNWGTALSNLAKNENHDENLYNQAFKKYETAFEINPKDMDALYNWGTSLFNLAKVNNDKNLYNQAFEKLNKAMELGSDSYNLACLYSIKEDKGNALKLLEKSLQNKDIEINYIIEDEDWSNFKKDEDFKEIIKKYS